jgi:hypothetical protein
MVTGSFDPKFEQVKAAFEANFDNHGEVGASLAIYQHGRQVVDLWGRPCHPQSQPRHDRV